MSKRFQDENLTLGQFMLEGSDVCCPSCSKIAHAKVDFEAKKARLWCLHCGYNKEEATRNQQMAAHTYFSATLWYQIPFKDDVILAYNLAHLNYLECYVAAYLREHKDRTHFTLLEKLPKFYHSAKNREALLKAIEKLKKKR
ncbi:hypothetical protein [Pedobacter sp. MW01-1-1]|uniref:hypothetical protein n=1 Tax=Pedobacter sp. MW01-1-1 TaxID=3383027 RepID=UPI003FF0DE6E